MRSKVVDIGDFVVIKERLALGKKVDEIIGTIANISYPSGEKDFAYVEVLFFNNETRWYPEHAVYTQKEKFLIYLIKLSVELGKPYKALSTLAKLVNKNMLQPVYIRLPEGEWVNGEYMLVESCPEEQAEEETPLPPFGGVGGDTPAPVAISIEEPKGPAKEASFDFDDVLNLVPDFDKIEDPVAVKPKEEARFKRINNKMAIMLIGRVGRQKEFTLANIVLFIAGRGLFCNNRLNRSIRDMTGKYISLEVNIPQEDYMLVKEHALKLYDEGLVYDFKSFDEVKSFILNNKKNKKQEVR